MPQIELHVKPGFSDSTVSVNPHPPRTYDCIARRFKVRIISPL